MTRRLSSVSRSAVVGICALLAAACSQAATAQTAPSQPPATDSTRQAYALMVADDNHRGHGDTGQKDGTQDGATKAGSTSTGQADHPTGYCDPVTLGVSPASPQVAGVTPILTASAPRCPQATYEFWIKPPTGTWKLLRAFGSKAAVAWPTAGLTAGTYAFDAWAKKVGSGQGLDVHISPIVEFELHAPVTAAPPDPCTSVTWNQPRPVSPQSPGMPVTLSGTASGCPNPLYEFWVRGSSSTTWTVLQPWSSSSTAAWDTTGLADGTYLFDVWAKHSSSASTWEAHISPNPTYTLQAGAACTSVTWNTPAPAAPQAPGTSVTLAGTAAGCPNPLYEFWIQAPGSTTWTVLQAYSSSSTATWDTTGLATGTYLFDIWARQLGSSSSWEAHISPNPTDVLEMGAACTSSSLTFSPASGAPAGTAVTLTASSAGCPNPTYEFWVQAPGGAWNVLQSYSSASTATWSTTGLSAGTYLFDVWVKNSGNSSQWEAHISPNPTFTLS